MTKQLTVLALFPATHLEQRINVWSWQQDREWCACTELRACDLVGTTCVVAHGYTTEPDAIEACRRKAERTVLMALVRGVRA